MKVFVAGATGALGRFLVPHLVEGLVWRPVYPTWRIGFIVGLGSIRRGAAGRYPTARRSSG